MNVIKPLLRDHARIDRLKRRIYGKSQNSNESLNSVNWTRVHKTVIVRKNVRHQSQHNMYSLPEPLATLD